MTSSQVMAEARARRTLRMTQRAFARIGDRGVREQHLRRRERARVALADAGAYPEEGHLEAARALRLGVLGFDPARHVPPFEAMVGMAALVLRELKRASRLDWRVGHARFCGDGAQPGQEHRRDEQRAHHQSSFTARTTSSPIARRPLNAAVAAAASTSTALSTASALHGTCTSMVQWNDWRLTT